ncbi:MAG: hypothetical protein ACLQDV_17225 [Candidatus Binataceae bacterium]
MRALINSIIRCAVVTTAAALLLVTSVSIQQSAVAQEVNIAAPAATKKATPTPKPKPTKTPKPTPTGKPTPTEAPTPTATPTPETDSFAGATIANQLQQIFGGTLNTNPCIFSSFFGGSCSTGTSSDRISQEAAAFAKDGLLVHAFAIAQAAQQAPDFMQNVNCSVAGTVTINVTQAALTIAFNGCVNDSTNNTTGVTTTTTANGTLTYAPGQPQTCNSGGNGGGIIAVPMMMTFSNQATFETATTAGTGGMPAASDVTNSFQNFSVTYAPNLQNAPCSLLGWGIGVSGTAQTTNNLNAADDASATFVNFTTEYSMDSLGNIDISYSGTIALTAKCFSGTYTVTTVQPFVYPPAVSGGIAQGITYPTAGELKLTNTATGAVTDIKVESAGTLSINGTPYPIGQLPKLPSTC